jgi:hypothetical protein
VIEDLVRFGGTAMTDNASIVLAMVGTGLTALGWIQRELWKRYRKRRVRERATSQNT